MPPPTRRGPPFSGCSTAGAQGRAIPTTLLLDHRQPLVLIVVFHTGVLSHPATSCLLLPSWYFFPCSRHRSSQRLRRSTTRVASQCPLLS